MIPVAQRVDDPENGDCFRACVCSILEFPIDAFPNTYHEGRYWMDHWQDWLAPLGLALIERNPHYEPIPGMLAITAMDSPKYKGKLHAVVTHCFRDTDGTTKRRILWDPSRHRDSLKDDGTLRYDGVEWHHEYLLVVRDPRPWGQYRNASPSDPGRPGASQSPVFPTTEPKTTN